MKTGRAPIRPTLAGAARAANRARPSPADLARSRSYLDPGQRYTSPAVLPVKPEWLITGAQAEIRATGQRITIVSFRPLADGSGWEVLPSFSAVRWFAVGELAPR
jgi:hypothetical protein